MGIKEGKRKSESTTIPLDWNIVPLKNISSLNGRIGWQGLKQSEFTANHDDPFLITGMNFKDGGINWHEVYHIPIERYEEAREIQLKNDDVLMTKDGTIGKLLYISQIPYPGKASLNSHLLVFRPLRNQYHPKFLFYQLNSKLFKDHIQLEKSGSTFFGITQEAVGNYKVILPPLNEQIAIATALSDADALIIIHEKLIAKKRVIKQGALQQLLTGRKRLPGFTGQWQTKKLGEISICLDSLRIPLNEKQRTQMQGNIPYCGANGILAYVSDFIIDDDIILLAEDGGYFDEYKTRPIAYRMIGKCWVNNHAHILKAKDGYDQAFLFYSLVHKNILGYITGGTRAKLNRKQLTNIEVFIPEAESEQIAISSILTDMDDEIEILEKKLAKYRLIKQGMMQELLTGKTRLI